MTDADLDPLDILHLDMDCFFAAVEVLENPALSGLPVLVGGTSNRGVVASASYEARAFGVHSAMSTVEARRRCPDAVFVVPHHDLYSKTSDQLRNILRRITPSIEPISLDEAFIDVRGAHRLFGDSRAIAERLRNDVASELGLSCSVGIGRTKLIAKLASKDAKPHAIRHVDRSQRITVVPGLGVRLVLAEEEEAFLCAQPLRALPGIGPKTLERLRTLGISTVAETLEVGRERLCRLFGNHQGNQLADVVNGIDRGRVEPDQKARSIGHEMTFARDIYDQEILESRIKEFAGRVISRANNGERVGKTVTIKVRFADFSVVTRSNTPARPCTNAAEIGKIAIDLLGDVELSRGIRLLGLHLSNFVVPAEVPGTQLALFGEVDPDESRRLNERRSELEEAVGEIRQRFGTEAVDPLAVVARRTDVSQPMTGRN